MEIEIKYGGEYPNLCSGNLTVIIDGKEWDFGECLESGGSVSFDDEWNEYVSEGEWSIGRYPTDFPDELKRDVLEAVNNNIEHGCCGGCV